MIRGERPPGRPNPVTLPSTPGMNRRPPAPRRARSGRRPPIWWLGFAVVLALNYIAASAWFPAPREPTTIPYTVFRQQVQVGNVVEVISQGDEIQGTFRQPLSDLGDGVKVRPTTQFATVEPAFADPGLEALLEAHGVLINARPLNEPRSWWMNILLGFGPTTLLILAFVWVYSRMSSARGGMFGLGRSRARRYDQDASQDRITFDDVAGIQEAKRELEEIVDFLRSPDKYTRLGGAVPKGVLLVGPPGTGKTLLARAVAGEAGVPFFSMGASEFVEMVVGVGASRVRDLFAQAREAAPSIIFIDELDAIGRARGGANAVSRHQEQEQTLNQILTEMDGFSSRVGVIVLAATNRPDVLDPALLRAGRFDRRVTVQPPDRPGRAAILQVHTRAVPLAPAVDLDEVAGLTAGLVGADLHNLVNEAALLAARRNQTTVTQTDFLDALEKLVLGPARQLLLSRDERRRIAYHEAGHALLGLLQPDADPVNRVTIIPHGQALGVTYQRPDVERHSYDVRYLRARLVGVLAGRAADEVVFGSRTTGAENDLQQATDLARQMVTRWGMSDEVGPVTLAPRAGGFLGSDPAGYASAAKPYSEATALLIDREVQRILRDCHAEAKEALAAHRPALDALAQALLERETLDGAEIRAVTGLAVAEAPDALARLEAPVPGPAAANGRAR